MISARLSMGQVATLDECDADLTEFKWYAKAKGKAPFKFYAHRKDGKGFSDYLHRVIMSRAIGRPLVNGEHVDHISGDSLDNRRCNLRLATKSQNGANRGPTARNVSGFKGVSFCRRTGKWQAHVWLNSKVRGLGYFADIHQAAIAHDVAALSNHGEFAWTNFPRSAYRALLEKEGYSSADNSV